MDIVPRKRRQPVSAGGQNTEENIIALCPNYQW